MLDVLELGVPGLTAAETRNAYAMVTLCGTAGLRIHEAVAADWCDFGGPCEGAVELLVHGKGDKERLVPVPQKPLRHLDMLGTRELHTLRDVRQARYLINKAFAACGFPKVESHQLRHAFATAAYKASHDIVVVQQLMGHADITTTQRYIGTPFAAGAAIVSSMERA